jgi:hypothetical protein
MPRRTIDLDAPLNLRLILGPLYRGRGDPTLRLSSVAAARATRTPDGPATLLAEVRGTRVEAEAWGPGAEQVLDGLPALLGLDDDPTGFDPSLHPVVAGLVRRLSRLRLGRTGAVMEALVPAILEQRVTGSEAASAFRTLIRRYGEPAPGPVAASQRLRLHPAPDALAALPYYVFHPLGVEQRRAEIVRRVARDARCLEALNELPGSRAEVGAAAARLRAYPGIGPWTAAESRSALGDPDAVSVGDHLPNVVPLPASPAATTRGCSSFEPGAPSGAWSGSWRPVGSRRPGSPRYAAPDRRRM